MTPHDTKIKFYSLSFMSDLFASMSQRILVKMVLAIVVAYYIFAVVRTFRNGYLPGDCYFYHAVAESLVTDHDIYIDNNINPNFIEGNTALSIDNKIVPKHTILLPILGLPFYWAFGKLGLFIFNCCQFVLLVFLIFKINLLAFDRRVSKISTIACLLGSYLLLYIPNFSPDILATVMILAPLLLIQTGRPLLGMFLGALSLFVKIYNAIPLALLGLMYLFWQGWPKMSKVLSAAAACFLGLLPMFIFNATYFGNPLRGGYNRTVSGPFVNGMWSTMDHTSIFNLPLWPGLWNILFDSSAGYVSSAPITVAALLGAWLYFRSNEQRNKALFIFAALVNVSYIILFAKYYYWNTSNFGNRFLMLPLALSSLFIGFAFKKLEEYKAARS